MRHKLFYVMNLVFCALYASALPLMIMTTIHRKGFEGFLQSPLDIKFIVVISLIIPAVVAVYLVVRVFNILFRGHPGIIETLEGPRGVSMLFASKAMSFSKIAFLVVIVISALSFLVYPSGIIVGLLLNIPLTAGALGVVVSELSGLGSRARTANTEKQTGTA